MRGAWTPAREETLGALAGEQELRAGAAEERRVWASPGIALEAPAIEPRRKEAWWAGLVVGAGGPGRAPRNASLTAFPWMWGR